MLRISNAKFSRNYTNPTYLLSNNDDNKIIKCKLSFNYSNVSHYYYNNNNATSNHVMLKFLQINSTNHTYEKHKNIKLINEIQQQYVNTELIINTTELVDNSKYSCCLIDHRHHVHSVCVYLIKADDFDDKNDFETRHSNCSQNYSKVVSTPSTINNNNNNKMTEKDDSFYGIEYPVLVIILAVILLIITACIKLSRNKNKKNNLNTINNLSTERQQHQEHSMHDNPFPFNFSTPQPDSVVFHIKPFQMDLPPSYDDVVKTKEGLF